MTGSIHSPYLLLTDRNRKEEEEMDFKGDIAINPNALDVEWVRQPALMGEWCEKLADAKAESDRAKERLDVVEAELAREVRLDPSKFGLEKITESAVSAAVQLDRRCAKATEELINAQHEVEVIGAAVRALEHKKAALTSLVALHGQQYFAGPSVPRDLGKETKELLEGQRRNGAREGIRRRMNKE